MFTTFFTIFTVGFCASGSLFSIFKYYKNTKHLFFLYFSIVCLAMSLRVLSISYLAKVFYLQPYNGIIAGFLIISFYIFVYHIFERVPKFLKFSLFFGVIFFLLYIITEIFQLEKLNVFIKPIGKYVDTIEVVIIGVFIFKQKEKYMRFIQYGIFVLFLIALLVYIPRVLDISFGVSQSIAIQIEAILGVCLFQMSIMIKEKGVESEKIRIENRAKELENQNKIFQEKIEKLEKKIITSHIYFNNIKLKLNSLIHISSKGHYIELFTKHKKEFTRGKLSEILKELPPNFVQVHRSHIVNLNYTKHVGYQNITLVNKTVIPLSKNRKNEVKIRLKKQH